MYFLGKFWSFGKKLTPLILQTTVIGFHSTICQIVNEFFSTADAVNSKKQEYLS